MSKPRSKSPTKMAVAVAAAAVETLVEKAIDVIADALPIKRKPKPGSRRARSAGER